MVNTTDQGVNNVSINNNQKQIPNALQSAQGQSDYGFITKSKLFAFFSEGCPTMLLKPSLIFPIVDAREEPLIITRNKSQMPCSQRRASRTMVSSQSLSHLFFSLKVVPRCCWNPAWYFQLLMPEKSQWNKRFILDRSCHSEVKMTFISRAYTMTGVIFRTWQQELSKVEWNCSNGARRASFEAAKQHAMLHGPFKLYSKTECNMVLGAN